VLTKQPNHENDWWAKEGRVDVWAKAHSLGLPIITEADLTRYDYDLLFSVYWPRVFPVDVLRHSVLNVNLHTAPLPECRGRYSCSMAILNGDAEFGPTLHLMEEEVDAGPIIARETFPISCSDTARTLYDKTNAATIPFLRKWLPKILDGDFRVEAQTSFAARTGCQIRSFKADALDKYFYERQEINRPSYLDLLKRALTFPPRYAPPSWLINNQNGYFSDSTLTLEQQNAKSL